MTPSSGNLSRDFVVLGPDKRAAVEPADAALYQRLDRDYRGFAGHELIACHDFDSDWTSWEVHPRGDETVVLMSGSVSFVLRTDGGEQTVVLREPGDFVVVPRGVWHTAKTAESARVLFVTPGEGTRHEAR